MTGFVWIARPGVLPGAAALSFCLAVCAAAAFAQPPGTGLQAGETASIQHVGDGLLRAKRAYRLEREPEVAELREAIGALRQDLVALSTADAGLRLESPRPNAAISTIEAGVLSVPDGSGDGDTGAVAQTTHAPTIEYSPAGAGRTAVTAAATAVSDTNAVAPDHARLASARQHAARVVDLARRSESAPASMRAAFVPASEAPAAPSPVGSAGPIAPAALERLGRIDSEIDAALALAEPARRARLATLAEGLRVATPAERRPPQAQPDMDRGMITRTERRRPAP